MTPASQPLTGSSIAWPRLWPPMSFPESHLPRTALPASERETQPCRAAHGAVGIAWLRQGRPPPTRGTREGCRWCPCVRAPGEGPRPAAPGRIRDGQPVSRNKRNPPSFRPGVTLRRKPGRHAFAAWGPISSLASSWMTPSWASSPCAAPRSTISTIRRCISFLAVPVGNRLARRCRASDGPSFA